MRLINALIPGLLLLLPLTAGDIAKAEEPVKPYKVIVHPGVEADHLEAGALKKIFMDKTTAWEGGEVIHLVLLAGGEVHEAFLADVVGKSVEQYASFWRMQSFTGKGLQPRTFDDDKEAVAYVAATPGAVGYVGKDTPAVGTKVLEVK